MFNLARSLDRNADRTPHDDAVIFGTTRLTHLQLLDRVNALAAGLREAGVGKGDIVALLMGNRPEFLESALAVNRIGAAFLSLNVRLAEPELEYIIRHAGAAAIVTEPAFAAPVAAIGTRLDSRWVVITAGAREDAPGTSYEELLGAHQGAALPAAEVSESDLHRLMYSSGTTAHPKGVPITYQNFYWKTVGHVAEFGISSADRTIMAGTSRLGLRISSAAPVDSSKPTHMNTRMPITVRKPVSVGLKSPAADVPCGLPCCARNAMNSAVNNPTTAILTNVPMFGPGHGHPARRHVHPDWGG